MIIQSSCFHTKNGNSFTKLLPWWLCLQCGRRGFDPWVGKIPWRRKRQSAPGLLPGKSHGQRSLVGYSPWGRKESEMTEWFHFCFSCVGHSCVLIQWSTFMEHQKEKKKKSWTELTIQVSIDSLAQNIGVRCSH